MERGTELPKERPTTIEVLSDEEDETTAHPNMIEAELKPLLRLEATRATNAPVSTYSSRVIGAVGSSETAAQSPVSSWRRPTESPQFKLHLQSSVPQGRRQRRLTGSRRIWTMR